MSVLDTSMVALRSDYKCGQMCRVDVRRVDSLPALRAIDWWNAARWVKTKGVRRAARARIDDIVFGLVMYVCCCGREAVEGLRGFLAC
jgi:hypothetical protein